MIRRPPRSTRTDTLFPYTTLFRSVHSLVKSARTGERDSNPRRRQHVSLPRQGRDKEWPFSDEWCNSSAIHAATASSLLLPAASSSRFSRLFTRAPPSILISEEHTTELQSLLRISYADISFETTTT